MIMKTYIPPIKVLHIPIPSWVFKVDATIVVFTPKYLSVPFGHSGVKNPQKLYPDLRKEVDSEGLFKVFICKITELFPNQYASIID